MNLKDFLRRVIYKEKATSESYIRYLRKIGVNIGEDCIFYDPSQSPIVTFLVIIVPLPMKTLFPTVTCPDAPNISPSCSFRSFKTNQE